MRKVSRNNLIGSPNHLIIVIVTVYIQKSIFKTCCDLRSLWKCMKINMNPVMDVILKNKSARGMAPMARQVGCSQEYLLLTLKLSQ